MRKALLYVLIFASVCVGSYHLTIRLLPNFIYNKFYTRTFSDQERKVNEFSIMMRPDENSRTVVKPNPDFAYATAFFDITRGPIRIQGTMPDSTYWSIATYQPNTINFFVRNDLQFASNKLDVVLAKKDQTQDIDILSAVDKGFVLIRLLIDKRDKEYEQQMLTYLESLQIESI